jgi:hypothetical protein
MLRSVYCSAATREMLLRLERYPCRINYANGILEARLQRYRHLRNLLVRTYRRRIPALCLFRLLTLLETHTP